MIMLSGVDTKIGTRYEVTLVFVRVLPDGRGLFRVAGTEAYVAIRQWRKGDQ